MGKFSDTKYVNTIDKLVDATKSKLVNPYYIFGDKKPTKVTYYAQNIEKSTLDEASGLYEQHVGSKSSFKFNKIEDFLLYGIEKIATSYEVGDFGTEANPITGEAIVLPNTITPRPGDFFSISYVKENALFKVTGCTPDTLDTGANIYNLEYSLELTDSIEKIDAQVEKSFKFLTTNVGTDFKTIVQDCDFDLITQLESLIEQLIVYFENLFFDQRLQTFVYNHDGWRMYDPFMIEFFIRNKVMSFGDEFLYVTHATSTNKTFGMDYTKTFFHCLENPKNTVKCNTVATADMITDPNSLFVTRLDYYYGVRYVDNSPYKTRFEIFNPDVVDHIKSGTMYEKGDENEFYNLWIAYFKNDKDFIKGNLIDMVKNAEYMDNLSCFYALGVTIFILERYIEMMLS